ncbi:MAG: DUF2058 domain-containing protein [Gammaproteobacteria bacterium]|nr:DUF2058 domain-containing protein [Gammaproteobacteria bacterium]
MGSIPITRSIPAIEPTGRLPSLSGHARGSTRPIIMSGSLREQLLKAGLVDPSRVKAANKERHKRKKAPGRDAGSPEETVSGRVEQARREKRERDRVANSERRRQAELRALRAEIGEIVGRHRLERESGQTPYQFLDRGKIRKIWVHEDMPRRLAAGQLAVVRIEGRYDVVPASVAERILEREERCVIVFHAGTGDDPDAADESEHPVPDDLMW